MKVFSNHKLFQAPCAQKPVPLFIDQIIRIVKSSKNKPVQVMLSLLPEQNFKERESLKREQFNIHPWQKEDGNLQLVPFLIDRGFM